MKTLKELREEVGLSREKLADMLNITTNVLDNYDKGRTVIPDGVPIRAVAVCEGMKLLKAKVNEVIPVVGEV